MVEAWSQLRTPSWAFSPVGTRRAGGYRAFRMRARSGLRCSHRAYDAPREFSHLAISCLELNTRPAQMTPETGWMVGTFTGFAVESVCATRYHATPAMTRHSTIRRTRTKTCTLVEPGVALRRDGGAGAPRPGRWRATALIKGILVPRVARVKPLKGRA